MLHCIPPTPGEKDELRGRLSSLTDANFGKPYPVVRMNEIRPPRCGRIDGSASSCCVLVSMLPGSVPRPCHRRRNAAEASTIDTASSVGMVAASVASYAAPTGREGVYLTFASQATHDAAFVSSIHPHQAGFPPFVSVPALGHTVVEAVGATEVKTETLVVEPRRHGCSREGLGGQAEKLRQASRVRTLRSIRAEAARWRSNRYNKKEGGLRRSEAMMWMALVGGSAASAGGGHAGQPPEGPLRRTVPCPARPSKLPSSGRSVRYSATRTGLELEVRCRGGERSGMKTILGRRRSRQLRHQSGRDRMVKVRMDPTPNPLRGSRFRKRGVVALEAPVAAFWQEHALFRCGSASSSPIFVPGTRRWINVVHGGSRPPDVPPQTRAALLTFPPRIAAFCVKKLSTCLWSRCGRSHLLVLVAHSARDRPCSLESTEVRVLLHSSTSWTSYC